MTQLTEPQLELLRATQFNGGIQFIRTTTKEAAYESLVDKDYVIPTYLPRGDMHFANGHRPRGAEQTERLASHCPGIPSLNRRLLGAGANSSTSAERSAIRG